MAAHGRVRATKDLDVWVRPATQNSVRVLAALEELGAPLQELAADDFSTPGVIFQIRVAPAMVDIIMEIDSVDLESSRAERVRPRSEAS